MATLKLTSPKGTANFPYLTPGRPDTEFKENGEYKVALIVPADAASKLVADIEKQIMVCAQEIADKAKAAGKSLDPAKIAPKLKRPFAEHDEDDSLLVFKFTQNAVIPGTGKPVTLRYFDSKGKTIQPEDVPAIYSGSTIRVSGGARTYAAGANKGVTLDIYAVQIIELAKGSQSSASADDFGFGEEDGFSYETDAEREGFAPSMDDDDDYEDEDTDF